MNKQEAQARRGMVNAKIRRHIDKHGWAILGVFPTEKDPGPWFTYTIGLTGKGLPELIMVGLSNGQAAPLLNDAAEQLVKGELQIGEPIGTLLQDLPAMLIEVDAKGMEKHPLNAAKAQYGEQIRALQLVWPDESGLFPWQEGFNPEMKELQPLLGDPPSDKPSN